MRIGIDISSVIYGTGVSVYTRNLVRSLLETDKKNEYVLFGGSLRRRGQLKDFLDTLQPGSFKGRTFPIPPSLADIFWNRLHILPIERLIGEISVLHSSDWTQPPTSAFKVTTIHDLVPFLFPRLSHPKIVAAHKSRMKWVIKEVDKVIVPTQTTAHDVEKLSISTERIKIIPEAPDPLFKPTSKAEIEKIKRKYRIPGKYLLAIGVNPRKNTERIIQAYEEVKAGGDLRLVIVGHQHMRVRNPRGVFFLGHTDQADMPALYSGAEALVYPSLYEGFGLPILEAFACKLPVVTSNLGSMAEIAGKGAILVDPNKTSAISEGILKAMKESEMLVKNGRKELKKYSWEKVAKTTLRLYEKKAK